MKKVTIQEALNYCLDNPDNLSSQDLLSKFPEYREELEPLLGLGTSIAAVTLPPVAPERRSAMKQRLLAAAEASPRVPQPSYASPQKPAARPVAATYRRKWWQGLSWAARPAWAL